MFCLLHMNLLVLIQGLHDNNEALLIDSIYKMRDWCVFCILIF